MAFDLVAGLKQAPRPPAAAQAVTPRVLVFDSGLGGLTVHAEVQAALPDATFLYLADDAVFPYGDLSESALVARVRHVLGAAIPVFQPHAVVIACGTASTLVLPPLRADWPAVAFVGTVPAIKPAAARSQSGMISVLATPGTVVRQYTRELVDTYAAGCQVTLVGASRLARVAEDGMRGVAIDPGLLASEITPAFVVDGDRRTDTIVLACTHYPLLLPHLTAAAPWPVTWVDPAAAIARRVCQVLGRPSAPCRESDATARAPHPAVFSSGRAPGADLATFLAVRGLQWQSSAFLAGLPRLGTDA